MSGIEDISKFPDLYTKETVVEFHYLLLFVLIHYRDEVELFEGYLKKGEISAEIGQKLNVYSMLLWRLARSSVLRSHLIFLRENGLISFDQWFKIKKASGGNKNLDGGGEGDDGEGGITEEMVAMESQSSHKEDVALLMQRWMLLLTSHLQSLHILSSFAAASSHPVDMQLLSVKHSNFEGPQDWTAVLKRTLNVTQGSLDYNEIESRLLAGIKEVPDGRPLIFASFEGKTIVSASGQVHCEAGLVAAISSPPSGFSFEVISSTFPVLL
jgi:hypothetical protein